MGLYLEIEKEERFLYSFFSGKFIGYNTKVKNRDLRCINYLLDQGLIDDDWLLTLQLDEWGKDIILNKKQMLEFVKAYNSDVREENEYEGRDRKFLEIYDEPIKRHNGRFRIYWV
jgi:hypothetical protein